MVPLIMLSSSQDTEADANDITRPKVMQHLIFIIQAKEFNGVI